MLASSNDGLRIAKSVFRRSEREIYMKWMSLKFNIDKKPSKSRTWSPFEDALILEGVDMK